MDTSKLTMAQQVAQAASAFEEPPGGGGSVDGTVRNSRRAGALLQRQWSGIYRRPPPVLARTSLRRQTLNIKPGSPLENDYTGSFNDRLWDGLLNAEAFDLFRKGQDMATGWGLKYNHINVQSNHSLAIRCFCSKVPEQLALNRTSQQYPGQFFKDRHAYLLLWGADEYLNQS